MEKSELIDWVKQDLLFKKLKLENMGVKLEDIKNETPLFGGQGLDLDSIDILEIAICIQQKFDVKIEKMNAQTAQAKFASPSTIAMFILELVDKKKTASKV